MKTFIVTVCSHCQTDFRIEAKSEWDARWEVWRVLESDPAYREEHGGRPDHRNRDVIDWLSREEGDNDD